MRRNIVCRFQNAALSEGSTHASGKHADTIVNDDMKEAVELQSKLMVGTLTVYCDLLFADSADLLWTNKCYKRQS